MRWLFLIFILALAAGFVLLLKRPIRSAVKGTLPTSDLLNATGLVVNVLVFVIGLASLYIAMVAYVDAKAAGDQQQRSLDESRKSLESVVQFVDQQNALMKENLQTTRNQLAILQDQWKTEQDKRKEAADV